MARADEDCFFPHWWEDHDLLAMFDAAYDEGGDGNTLLISLQLGQTKRLRRFSKKWKKVLRVAKVSHWHSKDYENYSGGVFAGLDHAARHRLLGKLVRLIHDFMDIGITAHINDALYKKLTTPEFRIAWGTSFCYGVETTLLTAFAYLSDRGRGSEPINVLISDGHVNVGQAVDHVTGALNGKSFINLRTCGKAANRDFPILQAADMLAYSEQKYITQSGREIFDALNVNHRPYRTFLFDCDEDLIESTKQGVEDFMAKRRAFGQRIKLP